MTVKTFLIAAALVAAASSGFAAVDSKTREPGTVQIALADVSDTRAQANARRGEAAEGDAETLPGGTALLLACLACIGFLATRRAAGRR